MSDPASEFDSCPDCAKEGQVTTWYVIDTRSNTIINAIECSGGKPEIDPKHWEGAEHLRLDDNPPMSMLENYRYWNERP